jgi:hypothetical protein
MTGRKRLASEEKIRSDENPRRREAMNPAPWTLYYNSETTLPEWAASVAGRLFLCSRLFCGAPPSHEELNSVAHLLTTAFTRTLKVVGDGSISSSPYQWKLAPCTRDHWNTNYYLRCTTKEEAHVTLRLQLRRVFDSVMRSTIGLGVSNGAGVRNNRRLTNSLCQTISDFLSNRCLL